MCPLIPTASNGLAVHAPLHECSLHRVNGRNVSALSTKYATVCLRVWGDSECLASEQRKQNDAARPRRRGEEEGAPGLHGGSERDMTYGPPCSFPPLVRAHGAPGELGTHPEAAPGEAPNLAPSARNGRLPWELWREKVRRIRDYMLFTMHARAAHAGPTAAGLAMARYAGLSSSAAEPWGQVALTRVWPCRLSLRGRL